MIFLRSLTREYKQRRKKVVIPRELTSSLLHLQTISARNKGNPQGLKKIVHSASALVSDCISVLVKSWQDLSEISRFFLTLASLEEYGQILTPKGVQVLAFRKRLLEEKRDDSIYLVGIEVPEKGTIEFHDAILAFVSLLEISSAVRKFRRSVKNVDLPGFADVGIEPGLNLHRMTSQGHYEPFRKGRHGKRTVIDIFGVPPSHGLKSASR